ncbi:MAG: hypothetical protein ACI9SP_004857 [Arenicella sp.]
MQGFRSQLTPLTYIHVGKTYSRQLLTDCFAVLPG